MTFRAAAFRNLCPLAFGLRQLALDFSIPFPLKERMNGFSLGVRAALRIEKDAIAQFRQRRGRDLRGAEVEHAALPRKCNDVRAVTDHGNDFLRFVWIDRFERVFETAFFTAESHRQETYVLTRREGVERQIVTGALDGALPLLMCGQVGFVQEDAELYRHLLQA